jgi:hypothetical protein
MHRRAVAAETALAEAEDGRDALVDEIQREYVLRSTHLAIVGAAERRANEALQYAEKCVDEAEAAERRANDLADALRAVTEQQPKTVEWLRANGIVFDGPLGTDPGNWQHVAFSIYNDLCEADSVARAALDRHTHQDKAVT